ncbi:unnamed protein product [Mucor hiemalis]
MPYINWNDEIHEIKTYHWCRVQDVILYLHKVNEFITRHTTENFLFDPPKLKYFDIPPVHSEDSRFSETEAVLCNEFGKWKAEIDLLQLSVTVMCSPSMLEKRYPDYRTVGETEVYALKKVNEIFDCIIREYWERTEFERYSNLIWEEAS